MRGVFSFLEGVTGAAAVVVGLAAEGLAAGLAAGFEGLGSTVFLVFLTDGEPAVVGASGERCQLGFNFGKKRRRSRRMEWRCTLSLSKSSHCE